MIREACVCFLGAFVVGCGGGGGTGADASTDVQAADVPADAPLDAGGNDASDGGAPPSVSLTIGPVTLGAGVEATKCLTTQLSNAGTYHVGTLHTVLTGAWRDLVVYRVPDTSPSPLADCTPLDGMKKGTGDALTFTQRDDEVLALPAGAGFTLADHQMIRLELHGVDDGSGFGATVTFEPMADAAFKEEAGMVLVGLLDISVPPGGSSQLHQTPPAPAITVGSQLLVMSGHQHALGTELSVGSIYDSTAWNAAPVTTLAPALTVTNTTTLDTTCKWTNATNNTVVFGAAAQNEQCFVRAHYAPATGSRICFHTEKNGTFDPCCPGDALCSSL